MVWPQIMIMIVIILYVPDAFLSHLHINLFNSQHMLGSFIIFILHGEELKHRGLSS